MQKSLAQEILEGINRDLMKRITEIDNLVTDSDDIHILILVKETIYDLIEENPKNSRLRSLLLRVKSKINGLR